MRCCLKDTMKINKLKLISLALAAALLCGCESVSNASDVSSVAESSAASETSGGTDKEDIYRPDEIDIVRQSFAVKLEAEKGSFTGRAMDDNGELTNADNGGFVVLTKEQHLTQVATVPSSQFYRVVISARSKEGASITFRVGDTVEGAYSVPPGENDGAEFTFYALDNLFMSAGINSLGFIVESGSVDIDLTVVEDSAAVSDSVYRTGNSCVTNNASPGTVALMGMLAEKYGREVLTAQNVSCGSNAEIDAVYAETGRYPAIRASELALAVKDDANSREIIERDLKLAAEWGAAGGICSYSWHWYSPNPARGTALKDFDLHTVLGSIEPSVLAMLDDDGVQFQLENGFIIQSTADLLADIDHIAKLLKPLCDADIPILFEPVPDGDTGLFWWGGDADSYRALWVLVFDRLTKYNGLNNLIWVWNNSDFGLYPGNDYVDIIGQSIYAKSDASFAGRFSALAQDISTGRKIIAVTACDVLPSIDKLVRDNAMWLWAAPDSGEYAVSESGKFSDKYTKLPALRNFYNNERCVTRDEL